MLKTEVKYILYFITLTIKQQSKKKSAMLSYFFLFIIFPILVLFYLQCNKLLGECNTILSAYTWYRHLE